MTDFSKVVKGSSEPYAEAAWTQKYLNDVGAEVYALFDIPATELAAGTSIFIPSPCAGYIMAMKTIVQVDIVTGGSLTVELGGVAVTGLAVVVANSSSAGDVDEDAPTTLRSATTLVRKDQAIEIVGDAAFNGGGAVRGCVVIEPI